MTLFFVGCNLTVHHACVIDKYAVKLKPKSRLFYLLHMF